MPGRLAAFVALPRLRQHRRPLSAHLELVPLAVGAESPLPVPTNRRPPHIAHAQTAIGLILAKADNIG